MNVYFVLDSALALLTAVIHIFAGGKSVVRPLLSSSLENEVRLTAYYCWHMATLSIVGLAAAFAWAAATPDADELAVAATVLAGTFAIWSAILTLAQRVPVLILPQWMLFAPIAALGVAGLAA